MARHRSRLVGRRAELDALLDMGGSGPVLVHGLPGSGKTALLHEARRVLVSRATPVLDVSFSAGVPEWDLFGCRAVLRAVREQYETFDTHPRLPDSLDDVSRLCTPEGYAESSTRFCLLHAMSTLFGRLSATAPVTVVLDDIDRLEEPVPAVATMYRAGHTVIASCRTAPAGTARALDTAFPRAVALGPLPPDAAADLLRLQLKTPVAPAVVSAVRHALGPLWGNAGAVVSTITDLQARKRFETMDGFTRLRDPETPIAVPADHPAFVLPDSLNLAGRDVVLLASGPCGLLPDDLHSLTRNGSSAMGQAVDELVRAGVLECDVAGRIRCCVPGLVTAVAEAAGAGARERLHRRMADRLLEAGVESALSAGALARHIAGAGRELTPRPEFVAVLLEAAGAPSANSAARVSHLHAAWWHTGPGAGRAVRQREIIRHLVRSADYPALATFVVVAAAECPSEEERAELALGAVLAALHVGRPVAGTVGGSLGDGTEVCALLGLADRWFAGDKIEPAEVITAVMPAWQRISFASAQSSRPAWRGRRRGALLSDACAVRDLAPVLAAAMGEDYRVPTVGPLSAYHRVCTGYAEGRWTDALAAVAELEEYDVDEVTREHSRLLAAELCGWRGEHRQAAEWLAAVPGSGRFPHLKAWVETGLCYHVGDLEKAFELGRHAFRQHPFGRDELGASRLLLRLAWLAGHAEDAKRTRAVVTVAETYHRRQNSLRSFGVLALVRGLADGDETEIHAAERLARRREDRELVLLREPAARLSESPRGWLREAYANSPAGGAVKTDDVDAATVRSEGAVLSDTENEILSLIRSGQTNRQIARTIRLSEKTVEKHLSRLFMKAGCRTRYGLATSDLGRRRDAIGA